MVQGWDTVGESALINGHQIRVRRKDLEAEDGCQDPNFFDDDYSIAASTGAVLCCALLPVPACAVLRCAVLRCAVLRCAVLRCAVLRCAVLCCAVLCCAVLCCAACATSTCTLPHERASKPHEHAARPCHMKRACCVWSYGRARMLSPSPSLRPTRHGRLGGLVGAHRGPA
jgi:hypothetical protein